MIGQAVAEVVLGTDFRDADTDGDGIPDGEETVPGRDGFATDPLDLDSDDDGLSDGDEVNTHGTDPLDKDSDDDGFPDGVEVSAGSDPLDPASTPPGVPALGIASTLLLAAGLLAAARRAR